jgi:very-short-patch-repair endonuclease
VGIRGLWVTSVPLTVLEAAVALGERGSELMDRALQGRVRFDVLHRVHCRNLGRRGATAAGRLLVAAADRAASAAERKLTTLLRAARITGWRQHYLIGAYEVDLAFPDQRVAVEVDGWAWHHDAHTFRNDRRRQNGLVLAGWMVLRFTWYDLTRRGGHVVAEICAALAARAAS